MSHYLLHTYDHFFLKCVYHFPAHSSRYLSHSAFRLCPFPKLQLLPPKSVSFFSILYIIWSYLTSIEFCINLLLIKINNTKFSELFNSLLISSYFSTFCKHLLLQFFNHSLHSLFFSLCIFHLVYSISISSSIPVLPLIPFPES